MKNDDFWAKRYYNATPEKHLALLYQPLDEIRFVIQKMMNFCIQVDEFVLRMTNFVFKRTILPA